MATMTKFDPTNWGGRGGSKTTDGSVSSGDAGRGWHVPNTRDRSTYSGRYGADRMGTSQTTDEHVRNPYNRFGSDPNRRPGLIDLYRANQGLNRFFRAPWWIADQISMMNEQNDRLNRLWEDRGWTWARAWEDLFSDPVSPRAFQSKNMGGYSTSYWCESRNLTCLGGNPFAIEYRRTAAVSPPATCPSVCTNTGTRHATFALASANGTAAQVRRTTNQLTGSVYAQWERISTRANGNPMVVPVPQFFPDAEPEPGMVPQQAHKIAVGVATRIDVDGRVAAKPSVRPSTDIVFNGDKPPVISNGEHVDRPDRAKKRRGVPPAMVAAIKLLHGLTEVDDFFSALYDALPSNKRCGGGSGLVHKILCVLHNVASGTYADPDIFAAAVMNLVENEVEDRVMGALLGSNWRTGVRNFNDQYGSTAWTDTSFGGMLNLPNMSPM